MRLSTTTIFLCMAISGSAQSLIKNTIRGADPFLSARSDTQKLEDWFKVDSISLYGGGSLFGLVTGNEDVEQATTPSGSLGLNFVTSRLSCDFYFSYNSLETIDALSLNQFGSILINPSRGGQSLSLSLTGTLRKQFGFSTSIMAVDQLWKIDSSTTIDASPFIFRAGLYYQPFDFDIENNKVNFILDVHYTHRSILGDFGRNDQIIAGETLKKRGYNGFDFAVNLYLNSVQIFGRLSLNAEKDDHPEIPGFTGTQLAFGINVAGELLKLK